MIHCTRPECKGYVKKPETVPGYGGKPKRGPTDVCHGYEGCDNYSAPDYRLNSKDNSCLVTPIIITLTNLTAGTPIWVEPEVLRAISRGIRGKVIGDSDGIARLMLDK